MNWKIEVDAEPFEYLNYRNAVGKGESENALLGFYRARASWLPETLEGLVVTADLQGIVPHPHTAEPELMGLAVAERLVELYFDGLIPQPSRMAAILAGDFFALPDQRGGFGCVAEVWQAFADRFHQVIGVAGNHDDVSRLARSRNVQLLDSTSTQLGGLHIGGVGLIMGNPRKPGRRDDHEQYQHLVAMAESRPDILLLHEGPKGSDGRVGHSLISEIVEGNQIPLTICGHKHWDDPVCRTGGGILLNVHERVLVIERG